MTALVYWYLLLSFCQPKVVMAPVHSDAFDFKLDNLFLASAIRTTKYNFKELSHNVIMKKTNTQYLT